MPTTTELRARAEDGEDVEIGHVLLIDGCPTGFTDNAGLVGVTTGGSHSVILGLSREGISLRMAIDLRTGQFLDSPANFTIVDFDGDLASLWRSITDDERSLEDVPIGGGLNVGAAEDLSTRTDLHDHDIGLERIGSAGQRHRYPAPLEYTLGFEHRISVPGLDLAGAPVSEDPIVWTGRRIVLYRCYRDHITYPGQPTQGWRPFSEAVRLWWGTMRDAGEVSGREWTIECDGPESWLRKPLGVGYQRAPVRVAGDVTLSSTVGEDETAIGVAIEIPGGGVGASDFGNENYTYAITGTTVATIRQDVIDAIADLADTTGGGAGTYNGTAGCHVSMDDQGTITLSVYSDASGPGQLTLALHRKVWELLGFDIEQQDAISPDYEDTRAVEFFPAEVMGHFFDDPPGPDYWVARFVTGGPTSPSPTSDADPFGYTNEGVPRQYRPWYLSGTQVLLADPTQGGTQAGQVVRLADAALGINASQSTVAHPGQYDRPVASSVTDPSTAASIPGVGTCDRQGLWLFFGKRRLKGTEDEFDEYQVARASWVNGTAAQDGLVNGDQILVTEWLDPGLFGFNRPRMGSGEPKGGGDWVARLETIKPDEGIARAVPILTIGYMPGQVDRADVVLTRLLTTSGTGEGWSGPSGDPASSLDPGDNEMTDTPVPPRDAEVAALGLAIPHEYIAPLSDWDAEVDKVDPPSILDVKAAFSSGYQAIDLVRALMQPVGWCWHLRDGLYGVWCPADPLTLADAEVVLDRSVKTATVSQRGRRTVRQELRKWQPVDVWKIDASWAPHLNRAANKLELQSPDPGYRSRPGDVVEQIPAHCYRNPFSQGIEARTAHVSRFWRARHFEVRGYPVPMLGVGERLWPGTIVRLTDPELVDPAGSYGVTNRIAIVTACSTTMGVDDGAKTVDLLVRADRSVTPRMHAPSARAYGYDSATRLVYVVDNWLGIEQDGWSDAAQFDEPSYTGIAAIGGDPVVEGWQWDGDTWSMTWYGTVDAVVTTPGAATLHLASAINGTYYRDMDCIVVLHSTARANGAWVDALYAPICNESGQWTDVATPTNGYPWEA